MTVRNPTKWRPPTGSGYVIRVGNLLLVTNTGLQIVTNSGENIVTNETYAVPKYKTLWTPTGA